MIAELILQGEAIRLRPLAQTDVPLLARWFFDPQVERWLQMSEDPPELRTLAAVREHFDRVQATPNALAWCIETKAGQSIGLLELKGIRCDHRRAELSLLIGEADHRGRGLGSDAVRTALRYAFEVLGLRRVFLTVDSDNGRAIRCYEKCGFQHEGRLVAHRLRYGEPIDMLIMGALRATGRKEA